MIRTSSHFLDMRLDPIKSLIDYHAGRDPERLIMKYRAISAHPFAFLRGTCRLYYLRMQKDIAPEPNTPGAWICGDLHTENFGSFKGDNGLVYFDMNDFDEAVLAPAGWEIQRLMASVHALFHERINDTATRNEAIRAALDGYRCALKCGKAFWMDRDAAKGMVATLFEGLRQRKRRDYIASRTEQGRHGLRLRTDHGKALPLASEARQRVEQWLHEYAQTTSHASFYRPIDVARRIAGTGSLGLDRYVILVEGKGGPDGHYLLDLKACPPSALADLTPLHQPDWSNDAQRVAEVGAMMQAVTPRFLRPVMMENRPFLLKGLQPSSDKVDMSSCMSHPKHFIELLSDLGRIAAWGQLRASGRRGAACADELIAFAHDDLYAKKLIDQAAHMADRVVSDWQLFRHVVDDEIASLSASIAR